MPSPTNGSTHESNSTSIATMIGAALRRIHVPRMMAATGSASAVSIGRLTLGDATIDRVVVQGVTANVDTGRVLLEDVRSVLDLRVGVSFRLRAGPFRAGGDPAVNMRFPFDIGTVEVPQLEDVVLSIPTATLNDAAVEIQPVHNLELGAATFADIELEDADLPSDGFGVSGLMLGPVKLTDITLPSVSTTNVQVGTFSLSGPLQLPAIEVQDVRLPSVTAPSVSSIAAVEVEDVQASRQSQRLVDLGFLRISVFAEPTLHLHIGALTLNDLAASSTINRIRVEDVQAPVTVRDIAVGDLKLNEVTVNQVMI